MAASEAASEVVSEGVSNMHDSDMDEHFDAVLDKVEAAMDSERAESESGWSLSLYYLTHTIV